MKSTLIKKSNIQLGFDDIEMHEIVETLNILLANYQIHYQKMRNFHWNVKGHNFFNLHIKFEDLYNEARINIDTIAERIRFFGKAPVCSFREYLTMSEIKETSTDLGAVAMVEETLDDMRLLHKYLVKVAESAENIRDVGTDNMVISFIEKLEKNHWMFTAWLKAA